MFMKVNGNKIKKMVRVNILGLIPKYGIKVNGKTINKTVLV